MGSKHRSFKTKFVAPSYEISRDEAPREPRPVNSSVCVRDERSPVDAVDLCQNSFCNPRPHATTCSYNKITDQGAGQRWWVSPYASSGPCVETGRRRAEKTASTEVRPGNVVVLEDGIALERRDGFDQRVVRVSNGERDHHSLGGDEIQSHSQVQTYAVCGDSRSLSDELASRAHQADESGRKADNPKHTDVRASNPKMEAEADGTLFQEGSHTATFQDGRGRKIGAKAHSTAGKTPRQADGLSRVNSSICARPEVVCKSTGDGFRYFAPLKASITMCRKNSKVASPADILAREVHLPEVDAMDVGFVRTLMNESTRQRFDHVWKLTTGVNGADIALDRPMKCPVQDALIAVGNGLAVRLPKGTPITCHAFSVLEDKLKFNDKNSQLPQLVTRRRCIDWARRFNDETAAEYKSAVDLRHHSNYFRRCNAECGATFDLKASFYQVLLPRFDQFTFLAEDGEIYGLTRMPMGISTAPEIMQILMSTLAGDPIFVKPAFAAKVMVDVWIDNVMFSGTSTKVRAQERIFVERAAAAKATINHNDSAVAGNEQTFIGIVFDFKNNTIDWSAKTLYKIGQLSFGEQMVLGDLESAVSRLMYASSIKAVKLSSYYWAIKLMRRLLSDVNRGERRREDTIMVPKSALEHLRSWKADLLRTPKRKIPDEGISDYTLYSDASNIGWGAVLIDKTTQQTWVTGERWNPKLVDAHINVKEAAALRLGLSAFIILQGKTVEPLIDNTSALGAIAKGYSPSLALNEELVALNTTLSCLKITLRRPTYVKSSQNPADFWSRNFSSTGDWALDPQAKG